jgi:hypothetical protein
MTCHAQELTLWRVIMRALMDLSFSFKEQRQYCNNALLFLLLPILTFVFTLHTSVGVKLGRSH